MGRAQVGRADSEAAAAEEERKTTNHNKNNNTNRHHAYPSPRFLARGAMRLPSRHVYPDHGSGSLGFVALRGRGGEEQRCSTRVTHLHNDSTDGQVIEPPSHP